MDDIPGLVYSCCDSLPVSNVSTAVYLIIGTLSSAIIFILCPEIYKITKSYLVRDKKFNICLSTACIRCYGRRNVNNQALANFNAIYNECDCEIVEKLSRIRESIEFDETGVEVDSSNSEIKENTDKFSYVFFVKDLPSSPWFNADSAQISGIIEIEKKYDVVYHEYENCKELIQKDCWQKNETSAGCWYLLSLINQGVERKDNIKHFSETMNLLRSCLGAVLMSDCLFANMIVSIISPATVIAEHYGPTNCRLRCHLGLDIPADENCYLTVAGQPRCWQRGRCLLFDDSYLHSVTNDTDEERVVLMFDLWHPSLSHFEIKTIKNMYPAVKSSL